jgi:hypothetical protein
LLVTAERREWPEKTPPGVEAPYGSLSEKALEAEADGDEGGAFEMAQRMSIVSTHWPVLTSHWRIVLSDEPVT